VWNRELHWDIYSSPSSPVPRTGSFQFPRVPQISHRCWYIICRSTFNEYHWYFLNIEDGVLFYIVMGMVFQKKFLTDSFCHWRPSNRSIRVKRVFISAFFHRRGNSTTRFHPAGCRQHLLQSPRDYRTPVITGHVQLSNMK